MVDELKQSGHQITLNLNTGNGKLDNYIDMPPYKSDPHLKLKLDGYDVTSLGLIIHKNPE